MLPSNVLWLAMACATFGTLAGIYVGRSMHPHLYTGAVVLVNMAVVIAVGALLWRSAA